MTTKPQSVVSVHTATHERAQLRAQPTVTLLATSPTFRAYTDRRDVIPVLADDVVSYVLDRLTEARGAALLTLRTAGGKARVVSLVDVTTQATGEAR